MIDACSFIDSGAIVRVDPDSGTQTLVASGDYLAPSFQFGIAIEANGDILVTANDSAVPGQQRGGGPAEVIRIDPQTGVQSLLSYGGILRSPRGIAVGKRGDIFVGEEDGRIVRVDPTSGLQTLISSGSDLGGLFGIAIDADENLLVANRPGLEAPGQVIRIDPTTNTHAVVSSGGSLQRPRGVAVGPGGDLFVIDQTASGPPRGMVIRVDPVTGAQTTLGSEGSLVFPGGIAVNGSGGILVADLVAFFVPYGGSGGIIGVDPATGEQTRVSSGGYFSCPRGVAVVPGQPNRPPVATTRVDARVECEHAGRAEVTLDGSASMDPDSKPDSHDDIATYQWYENFGLPSEIHLGDGPTLMLTLSLGHHAVTLKVTDKAGLADTAHAAINVEDTTAPRLECPADVIAECQSSGQASIHLPPPTASDDCHGTVTLVNDRTPNGGDASDSYGLGYTYVTFLAYDTSGNGVTCTTSVLVRDTTPPQLSLGVSPTLLWPPNHRMVPVQPTWQVVDACDPSVVAVLVSATSSESDDGPGSGDGNTTDDIQDAAIGTPDTLVSLRAERSGGGQARNYALTYLARDVSGNSTSAAGLVTVPHDLGSGPEPLLLNLESGGIPGMAHLYWNIVPGAKVYDLIRGESDRVRAQDGKLWLGPVHVLAAGISGTSFMEWDSETIPAPGRAFFYLAQYRDDLNESGWGTESASWPEIPSSCDGGCPGNTDGFALASDSPRKR